MRSEGAWVPYWQYDAYCMSAELASEVSARFSVELRPVEWQGAAPGDAMQIIVPTVGESWFDQNLLTQKTVERHGSAGNRCAECDVWRWFPLLWDDLHEIRTDVDLNGADIAASPEWFGDGLKAFREIVVKRELATFLQSASPRDFTNFPL